MNTSRQTLEIKRRSAVHFDRKISCVLGIYKVTTSVLKDLMIIVLRSICTIKSLKQQKHF